MRDFHTPSYSSSLNIVNYKIYISGKITGLPYHETLKRFKAVEELLKNLDQEVINPMRLLLCNDTWQHSMLLRMTSLCKCNAIYSLDDHLLSKESTIEYNLANRLGFKLINKENLQDIIFNIRQNNEVLTHKDVPK